ncbi:MAG TPA: hypothetical protein VKY31_17600 [Terriglobia bacterium]|nr:hypothetical protein [Terriglobia bacterium]
MNANVKLVALLLVAVLGIGAVVYQLRNRKPIHTPVVQAPSGAGTRTVSAALPPAPAPEVSETLPAGAPPAAVVSPIDQKSMIRIPDTGWARNPFLTPEEIDRLNQPETVVAETPAPKPVVEPPALPAYSVTGIISGGSQGNWAIIDSRSFHAGDHIGSETVKQIKDRSVVLEHEGHTRELPLKSIEETAAAAPPKKEAKQ